MIYYKKGSLLDVTSGIIVHGCNMRAVMGSGVAKSIKEKYPKCFTVYKNKLLEYRLKLGDVIYHYPTDDLLIANALTQDNYGTKERYVNYVAVANAFQKVIQVAHLENFTKINFPFIGAGLAGGDWNIISNIIDDCDPENTIEKICWKL
jgi:O-acetyl-ADP-ribose deacetylase (regulator of RNase III)